MENTIKTFRDLFVWQKSMELVLLIYKITEKFPNSEIYGISNQMRRCAVSIPSNISEGFSRKSTKEFIQFTSIAFGLCSEIETQIEISNKLGYMNENQYSNSLTLTIEIAKMLNKLLQSLKNKI